MAKFGRLIMLDHEAPKGWKALAVLMAGLGSCFLYATFPKSVSFHRPGAFVFFTLMAIAAEFLFVELPRGGGVSVSFATNLASIGVLGPGMASLAAGIGMVVGDLRRWPTIDRTLFNFGQIVLSTGLAGLAFKVLGGDLWHASMARNILPVAVAAVTYFAVNATLATAGVSTILRLDFKRVWRANVRWGIPSYLALAPLGVLVAIVYISYGFQGSLLLLVPLLLARYSFLQYLSVREANVTVVQALAAALEAKDSYTKGHSDRVAQLAEEVAKELKLTEEQAEVVRYSAEMHDIGKIGVPEALLNKPGALTSEELAQIRQHAAIGASILGGIHFLAEVSNNIMYHHEWFDGSNGYPGTLSGDKIPLGARILMVCDSYDAMTSDRPYRKALDFEEAIRRLHVGEGTQFDPVIVKAFLAVLGTRGTVAS